MTASQKNVQMISKAADLRAYHDAGRIAPYASQAVQRCVAGGIIGGKPAPPAKKTRDPRLGVPGFRYSRRVKSGRTFQPRPRRRGVKEGLAYFMTACRAAGLSGESYFAGKVIKLLHHRLF